VREVVVVVKLPRADTAVLGESAREIARRTRGGCDEADRRDADVAQRATAPEPQSRNGRLAVRLALGVHRVLVQQHLDLVLPRSPPARIGPAGQKGKQRPSQRRVERRHPHVRRVAAACEPRVGTQRFEA